VHRGASLFVESAERVTARRIYFDQPGGNGVMLSNHVVNSSIEDSLFLDAGESAILSLGRTALFDGRSQPDTGANENSQWPLFPGFTQFPTTNTIRGNFIDNVGVYAKQSAAYFQAKSHGVLLEDNVMMNGPRSGININDGFMGDDTVQTNLIVAFVLESSDHGPVNTWDRDPMLSTNPVTGLAEIASGHGRLIAQNFIVNRCFFNCGMGGLNQNLGGHCIDHDDGSSGYVDKGNVLLYGAVKTRDGVNRTVIDNLMLYGEPGLLGPQCGGQNSTLVHNNVAVSPEGDFFACVRGDQETDFPDLKSNRYFSQPYANGSLPFNTACSGEPAHGFDAWQAKGLDIGSSISGVTNTSHLLALARMKLGM